MQLHRVAVDAVALSSSSSGLDASQQGQRSSSTTTATASEAAPSASTRFPSALFEAEGYELDWLVVDVSDSGEHDDAA